MLEATERVDCFQATDKFKGWNASLFSLSLPPPSLHIPSRGRGEHTHTKKTTVGEKEHFEISSCVCVCACCCWGPIGIEHHRWRALIKSFSPLPMGYRCKCDLFLLTSPLISFFFFFLAVYAFIQNTSKHLTPERAVSLMDFWSFLPKIDFTWKKRSSLLLLLL